MRQAPAIKPIKARLDDQDHTRYLNCWDDPNGILEVHRATLSQGGVSVQRLLNHSSSTMTLSIMAVCTPSLNSRVHASRLGFA